MSTFIHTLILTEDWCSWYVGQNTDTEPKCDIETIFFKYRKQGENEGERERERWGQPSLGERCLESQMWRKWEQCCLPVGRRVASRPWGLQQDLGSSSAACPVWRRVKDISWVAMSKLDYPETLAVPSFTLLIAQGGWTEPLLNLLQLCASLHPKAMHSPAVPKHGAEWVLPFQHPRSRSMRSTELLPWGFFLSRRYTGLYLTFDVQEQKWQQHELYYSHTHLSRCISAGLKVTFTGWHFRAIKPL